MSGVGGQGREIDAEFAEGALPFAIDLAVEEDLLVGGNMQPAILLQLTVELVRSPAGVAEGKQALARSLAEPHGAVLVMKAQIDHRADEAVILHLRHGHE